MEKTKKEVSLFHKILRIIGIVFAIIIILFWREIYQGILYADICLKHMVWQDYINQVGNYKLTLQGTNYKEIYYCNKEKVITENYDVSNPVDPLVNSKMAIYNKSDIPNTQLYYFYHEKFRDLENVAIKMYFNNIIETEIVPYAPLIQFEKSSFWDLFKTGKTIINIRIVERNENSFYEIYFDNGSIISIDKDTGLLSRLDDIGYSYQIGGATEENLSFPNGYNIILADYVEANRNMDKTNVKISNCEEEAGKIVSYNFEIDNINGDTLEGFYPTNYENIKIAKIMNNITYKKFQEKFEGLRDLTDEDFDNYFVIIAINTNNQKQLDFKELVTNTDLTVNSEKTLHFTETDLENNLYSGELIIIPNSEDTQSSGATVFAYGVSIEE